MIKGIADTEYPSQETIAKKSALLLGAMNRHVGALHNHLKRYSNLSDTCKAEEVARSLGISVREVWLKASKGEITPCLQLTNQTMYAIKGLNPIGLVSIGGLFTLSKGAIPDWFSRGTGTFSTNTFFPIRLDSILDESWMGDIAAPMDSFEPPMFLWKDAPLETADKFQMAVSVGEPTDRTIHLNDFLYLREQVESLLDGVTNTIEPLSEPSESPATSLNGEGGNPEQKKESLEQQIHQSKLELQVNAIVDAFAALRLNAKHPKRGNRKAVTWHVTDKSSLFQTVSAAENAYKAAKEQGKVGKIQRNKKLTNIN